LESAAALALDGGPSDCTVLVPLQPPAKAATAQANTPTSLDARLTR
jgi:hypothetical protein